MDTHLSLTPRIFLPIFASGPPQGVAMMSRQRRPRPIVASTWGNLLLPRKMHPVGPGETFAVSKIKLGQNDTMGNASSDLWKSIDDNLDHSRSCGSMSIGIEFEAECEHLGAVSLPANVRGTHMPHDQTTLLPKFFYGIKTLAYLFRTQS